MRGREFSFACLDGLLSCTAKSDEDNSQLGRGKPIYNLRAYETKRMLLFKHQADQQGL